MSKKLYGKSRYILGGLFIILLGGLLLRAKENTENVQQGIAEEILRFHVIAESDSQEDQILKLKVRDGIIMALEKKLKNVPDKKEAKNVIVENLDYIEETAENIIINNGFTYKVSASLEYCDFPTKVYGDLTFPAGKYEALRVKIGKAEGKNWWCVMYPPLCFVDSTYQIVPEESKEKLKYLLTDDEYEEIIKNKKVKVKFKFRICEWIEKLF